MQTRSNTVVVKDGSRATDTPLRTHGVPYDNVHDMKHDCEVVGWDLDYHQIEPGHLRATVASRQIGDIWMMIKQVNLRVEVLGMPPADNITVISPDTGRTVWANGFRLEDGDALLLRPDARLHLVGGPTIVVQAHVPLGLLVKAGMSESDLQSLDSRDGALLVDTSAAAAESLRWLTSSTIYWYENSPARESRLAASAANVIGQAIKQQRRGAFFRSESWRTISRAREYIEANLHQPISMNQVSDFAAASVSKLERTFRRELSVTPSQYILARRLHGVNRELGSAICGDLKVSELAMRYGFRHLGRFSAAYRSHFGELPSQTLQAQLV